MILSIMPTVPIPSGEMPHSQLSAVLAAGVVVFTLIVWSGVAAVTSPWFFPSPLDTILAAIKLLREGVHAVFAGHVPRRPSAAELALVGGTMLVNVAVVWFERHRGRTLRSAFLLADAEHTRSDIYVTLAALGSLVLTRLGWGMVDPVLALAVALVIAWHGFEIVRGTVPVLVDARAVDAAQLTALLRSIPRVLDVRTVRSRASASGLLFAEVTIGVDSATTVEEAHEISDEVEARIAEELGASEVTVHVEPA